MATLILSGDRNGEKKEGEEVEKEEDGSLFTFNEFRLITYAPFLLIYEYTIYVGISMQGQV